MLLCCISGLLLRDKWVHNPNTGTHWAVSILFALVQELACLYDPVLDHLDGKRSLPCSFLDSPVLFLFLFAVEVATRCIEAYNAFVDRIEELNLPGVVEARPILDVRSHALAPPTHWMYACVYRVAKSSGYWRASLVCGWARCWPRWSNGSSSLPRALRKNAPSGSGRNAKRRGCTLARIRVERMENGSRRFLWLRQRKPRGDEWEPRRELLCFGCRDTE